MLYGRYVQDNNVSKYVSNTSRVNGILQNKNNMSRDIKGKLYSFYTDIVSSNKLEDKHKNMNINRMFALGNNNKQHSLYANRNYDEIKQRESVEKTKHEIYDMLSNPPQTKRLRKSHSHIDMFNFNNINNNKTSNTNTNTFSNGIRSQITRLLSKRATPNPNPKQRSGNKNVRSFSSTINNGIGPTYNDNNIHPHKDFELYMNKEYYTKHNDKCSKLETKLKLYSL